ncbi:Uma2 family endonuclease [Planktothrix agardhii 1803]|uniref:Uma2 family endonuclease n=1 Tax=Planktothrix agardhii TaxID=1160 RepID=UPI001F27181E|nr:Uma2 family endonuclease [Planktothrix agardhii]MCF3573144.1 Uma2 family endonuclease [Planktothrix agardhii 1805]MCF3583738.1 Uma2 family endonuclease [Planktothrix agardhii 1803]
MTTLVSIPESPQKTQWQPATWEDYLAYVNNPNLEEFNISFNQGYLWIDMGNEGINDARFNELLTLIFGFWFARQPDLLVDLLGGCVIEKPNQRAAAPDKVLYIGENSPKWQEGEPRRINLEQWRVPDLVGEISDTTLAIDLDEKKQLYAGLGVPEYWVIDIRGKRAIAFRLQENGKYQEINTSIALNGLPIALLELTLEQLEKTNNFNAAFWFSQQIINL